MLNSEELSQLSQMYAFVGNSLLKPMNQTAGPGLDPAFWSALPDFGSAGVREALDELFEFSLKAAAVQDASTEVSVEYTRLFVGPPSPAAAPWETYYPSAPEGVDPSTIAEPSSGFGEPTFTMKKLLRESGLVVNGDSRQMEDHIGIELLYLSILYDRAAQGDSEALDEAAAFIVLHPGHWIDRLTAKVETAFPSGYIASLLHLTKALLAL